MATDVGADNIHLPIQDFLLGEDRIDDSTEKLWAGYGDRSRGPVWVRMGSSVTEFNVIYHATKGLPSQMVWRSRITDPSTGNDATLTLSSTKNITFAAGSIKFSIG